MWQRATSNQQPALLGSWKEIASYFGKGVRTVQRWEQQFGLPVRRPNASSRGVVAASRDELEYWFDHHWKQQDASFASIEVQTVPSPEGLTVRIHRETLRSSIQVSQEIRKANASLAKELGKCAERLALESMKLAETLVRDRPLAPLAGELNHLAAQSACLRPAELCDDALQAGQATLTDGQI